MILFTAATFRGPGERPDVSKIEQHRLTSRDWVEGRVKEGDKLWYRWDDGCKLEAVTVKAIIGNIGIVLTWEDEMEESIYWTHIDEEPCLFAKWFRIE